jgi:MFS family permease
VRLIERLRRADPALSAMVAEGFLSRLSFGIVSFALPLYALELGLGVAAIGVLASLNLIVAMALKPLAGWAADRVGLKLSLTAAIALRSAVSLLLALATVPWQLFATRSVHGVSIALRDPAVNALIAEGATRERLASAFAWYQTAKSVAGSLGKVIAGLAIAATASSFSLVFGFAFLLSALPAYVVVRYVREPDRSAEPVRAVASQSNGDGASDGEPARPKGILRFAGVGFAISGTGHMLSTLFPVLAVEYAGLTAAQAGLLYSISAAVALLGPAFGWLSDNVSRRLVLQTRGVANVLSSALYLVAPGFAGFAAGKAVDDAGKAAFRPAWGALMAHVSSFDRRRRAQLMGYMSAGEDAGEMAGPILAGLLWSTFGAPVLLVARMGLALGAEIFTWRMTRDLEDEPGPRGLEDEPGPRDLEAEPGPGDLEKEPSLRRSRSPRRTTATPRGRQASSGSVTSPPAS